MTFVSITAGAVNANHCDLTRTYQVGPTSSWPLPGRTAFSRSST